MTAAEIINNFELFVGDTTELSSTQELSLLNKWYYKVCNDKTWEILKKEATGTMTSTTTITLPADFSGVVENYNYTDNQFSTEINQKPAVVFITSNGARQPMQIVNWSDRQQYINNNGYCYLDLAQNKIIFCATQPSGASYSFDYKFFPPALGVNDTPIFPAQFHDIFYHGMCVDDMTIQLFDRARSYAPENKLAYADYLASLSLWNANLRNE